MSSAPRDITMPVAGAAGWLGLPFRRVIALDFEFIAEPGALPVPVCLVAKELGTGQVIRLWQDELRSRTPPFPVDDDTLFVAYFASAEIGCFLALGWPVPTRVLDLYVEFRNATNGMSLGAGRGLLGALSYHGVPGITAEQKTEDRGLVMRGGPWSTTERRRVLDYCQSDVDVLAPLLERMLPAITARPNGLGQAVLRGRYMAAVARMERTGVPIDSTLLDRIRTNWDAIKTGLIADVDEDYHVYEGTTFKTGLFAKYLADQGIAWPRTGSGALQLDQETFRDMVKRYPNLEQLKDLRHSMSELRLEKLAVGPDHRNRVLLSPFGASSGRNTPSNSKFIFGPSVWLRGLIQPPQGRALAYVDWKAQEVYIAAQLSGDQALLDAVLSGDPYLAFAKMAGLVPPDATKESHKDMRDLCKTCVLGTNYGMQEKSLALRTGLSVIESRELLRRLGNAFPTFAAWAEQVVNVGQLGGHLSTVFGWRVRAGRDTRSTTLRNFPMQANGAEMLRLACCYASERGVEVCAPVHDALLVEGDAAAIEDTVTETREAMAKASQVVLAGLLVDTDVEVIAWPARYSEARGQKMWATVIGNLEKLREVEDVEEVEEVEEVNVNPPTVLAVRGRRGGRGGRGAKGSKVTEVTKKVTLSNPTPPPIHPMYVVKG